MADCDDVGLDGIVSRIRCDPRHHVRYTVTVATASFVEVAPVAIGLFAPGAQNDGAFLPHGRGIAFLNGRWARAVVHDGELPLRRIAPFFSSSFFSFFFEHEPIMTPFEHEADKVKRQ